MCYRFSVGLPFFLPDNTLSYPANFLTMMWRIGEYEVHPVLERAMDVLFILHADHEQNCGTTAMRVVGSSHADPYSAAASAAAALYGPLHGGANEAVVRMLTEIGSIENVPAFIDEVKAGNGRLMGFGHRVYKNYDPRARIIKQTAYDVFEVTGKNPLLDIALKLEEVALGDSYFVDRKLYPNVDFYSGLIYQALGFPVDMFTVLFAIPRMVGWLAHWDELLNDSDQKISRPRQWYTGQAERDYVKLFGALRLLPTDGRQQDRTVHADAHRFGRVGGGHLGLEAAVEGGEEVLGVEVRGVARDRAGRGPWSSRRPRPPRCTPPRASRRTP